MAPRLSMVSHGHIFGCMDTTGRLGCSEAMSRGCLESTANVRVECPIHSPAGNLSDGLMFLAMLQQANLEVQDQTQTGAATTCQEALEQQLAARERRL